jgi:hypothetical protein
MSPDLVLLPVWGLVTSALVVLLLYHFSLTHQTPGRVGLTTRQAIIDKKAKKVIWRILWLSMLSAVLLLVIMGVWLSRSISG